MLTRIKYLLIGSPLATYHLEHRRLNKIRALAALSPNALSSFAYANEEIFLGLVVAGAAGLSLSLPINWNYMSNSRVSPVSDSVRMFREILQVRLNDWRGLHDKGQIRNPSC